MTEELMSLLNQARKTLDRESSSVTDARPKEREPKSKKTNTKYDRYRARLEKGDIDTFTCDDVLFFFYDLMKEHHEGKNYFISNVLKEKKLIKTAIERYGARRVLEMTEYLMTSEQTLLKVGTFSPAILCTKWGNTVNVLTEEWIETMNNPTKPSKSKREWGEPQSEEYRVKIGEWGDE